MAEAVEVPGASPVFGDLLRRYRVAAALTQEALAEKAHLSVRAISDLERGVKRSPRRDTLALLTDALQLSPGARAEFEAAARPVDAAGNLHRASHPDPSAVRTDTLVGRGTEMALLKHFLGGAGPPLLFLAGEPGIGKTRLLQEAVGWAPGWGWRVLSGGCQRRAAQEPFAPLLEALARHLQGQSAVRQRADLEGCAWPARLLPELAETGMTSLPQWTLPAEQERRLMFKAVARLLSNVAGPAGTLLVLDDLQWAGPDALDLLAGLAHAAPDARLRVLGAYRGTDVSTGDPLALLLADLAQAGLATHHELAPLAIEDAALLLADLLGRTVSEDDQAFQEQMLQRTGGVPFFLVSCAQAKRLGNSEIGADPTLPWDMYQSIRQRVAALTDPARLLLAAAAVIGRTAPRPLLSAVLEEGEHVVLEALESACRAGLLEEVGEDTCVFVHDVIREVVESDLGPARRCLLHRRVALALEGQAGKPKVEALAYHFRHGGSEDRAAVYLEQAGDLAALQYAHGAAVEHYRELTACQDGLGHTTDLARAGEKLGEALIGITHYQEALAVLEQASKTLQASDDLDGMGRVEARIATIHSLRGTISAGLARLQPILPVLDAGVPSPSLALAYAALCRLFTTIHPDRALIAYDRAVEIARLAGDPRIQAEVELVGCVPLLMLNRADEALETAKVAVRLAEQANDRVALVWALSQLSWIHEERGEYEEGRLHAQHAHTLAERLRDPEAVIWNIDRLGVVAFLTGDWPRARAYYEQAIAFTQEIGFTETIESPTPRLELGRLYLAEGAWEEGSRYLAEGFTALADIDDGVLRRVAQSQLADWDLLTGNPAAARARLLPLLDRHSVEERMVTQFILPGLAWAECELGEVAQAEVTVTNAVRRARIGHCRVGLVQALRIQALVALKQEQWEVAEHALTEGLVTARDMPYPHGEGRLLQVHGLLHARKGAVEPARERLEEALIIFRRLGARKDVERAEHDLTGLGR